MLWRLIVDPPDTAARNMAVDEALFRSHSAPRADADAFVSTVRLYRFERPTVSLGYRQAVEDAVDAEACRAHAVAIVRRITGGWALLHQDELTWSVAARTDAAPFQGRSVRGAYRAVNGVLRQACRNLGVPVDPEPSDTSGRPPPRRARSDVTLPCLAAPSAHEITAGGRKLVPSAQRRKRESFLQHGSILYSVGERLWRRIQPRRSHETGGHDLGAVGLRDLLDEAPPLETLVQTLESAFAGFFGEPPSRSSLEADERSLAESLVHQYESLAPRVAGTPY